MSFMSNVVPRTPEIRATVERFDLKYFRLGVSIDPTFAAEVGLSFGDRVNVLEGIDEHFGCIQLVKASGGRYRVRPRAKNSPIVYTAIRMPAMCHRQSHAIASCEIVELAPSRITIRLPVTMMRPPPSAAPAAVAPLRLVPHTGAGALVAA